MVYTTPPTFSSPWDYSDANAYIRDNFVSVRRYMQAPRVFVSVVNLNTVLRQVFGPVTLGSSVPDEPTTLFLMGVIIKAADVAGFPNVVTARYKNQSGADMFPRGAPIQVDNYELYASIDVPAGTQPGFSLWASCAQTTAGVLAPFVQGAYTARIWAMIAPQ